MNDDDQNVPMDGGEELSPEEMERRKQEAGEAASEGDESAPESTEESM